MDPNEAPSNSASHLNSKLLPKEGNRQNIENWPGTEVVKPEEEINKIVCMRKTVPVMEWLNNLTKIES